MRLLDKVFGPRYAIVWTNEHGPWKTLWGSTHRRLRDAETVLNLFVEKKYVSTMRNVTVTHFGIIDLKRGRLIRKRRV